MKALLNRRLAGALVWALLFTIIAPPTWAQGGQSSVVGRHRAILVSVSGTVEVKPVGQNNWVAAAANREVKTGDKIRTAAGSKCKIKVGDVGDIELQSSTEVTVGNLQQVRTTARAFFMFQRTITRDDVAVEQKSGDIRNSFRRVEGRVGNYNIYTPVATAGVRGTKFELDLEGGRPWYERMDDGKGDGDEQSLNTTVLEGEVELMGPNWSRSVSGGQSLQVNQNQIPGNPTAADPNKLNELNQSFTASADATAPVFRGARRAVRATSTSVDVSWNAASDDSSAVESLVYDIYVSYSSGSQNFSQPTATSEPGATSVTLSNLDADANTYIVVRARDEAGNRDNNTVQVSVVQNGAAEVVEELDEDAPAFGGANSVTRLTPTSLQVDWYAASDNASDAEEIAYDVYLSTYPSGQDYSTPAASSDSGASSITLSNLVENQDYYIVVRARDAAGNRDDNTEEVTTFVYSAGIAVDTNTVIIDATDALFDAYMAMNQTGFLDFVSSDFAGVNNAGNVLTYATLPTSMAQDFASIEKVTIEATITSISNLGSDMYAVSISWNGTFKFVGYDADKTLQSQSTKLIWDVSDVNEPLLVSWEGSSPFGLSNPETTQSTTELIETIDEIETFDEGGGAVTLDPPAIQSIDGLITSYTLTGNYEDLAPQTATINGTGFQQGSTVWEYDDDDGVWEDITMTDETDIDALVYFISETELRVDFSKYLVQFFNEDSAQETIELKVVNPDGQESNIYTYTFTTNPGPLALTAVSTNAPVTNAMGTTYVFTVSGYNIVSPITSIAIVNSDFMPVPDFTVGAGMMQLYDNHDMNPMTLIFSATVGNGNVIPAGTYYVQVDDARSDRQTIAFTVTEASSNNWTSSLSLNANYAVANGQTLTINPGVTVSSGSGYSIIVDGTLNASGATFDNVNIIFNAGSSGTLNGITVQNASAGGQSGVQINGGTVTIDNSTISNCATGMTISGGTVSASNSTISGSSNSGVTVTGGNASLSSLTCTTNDIGLLVNGAVTTVVTGGSYSQNASAGVSIMGGATVSLLSNVQINMNGSDGVLVSDASTVIVNGANISSNTAIGIHLDPSAAGSGVSVSNSDISGSTIGIQADAGGLALSGGNSIGATSNVVEMRSSATLATTGANTLSGGGGAAASLLLSSTSSGNIGIGDGTVFTGSTNGIKINGSGTVTITGASTRIENNTGNGIDVSASTSNISITGGAKVQNNGGVGIMVADAGTVLLNGIDVVSNAGYGVSRPSAAPYGGSVSLNDVLLSSNNGESVNDTNTSPGVSNSTQYQYLVYPPNTVSNPR